MTSNVAGVVPSSSPSASMSNGRSASTRPAGAGAATPLDSCEYLEEISPAVPGGYVARMIVEVMLKPEIHDLRRSSGVPR